MIAAIVNPASAGGQTGKDWPAIHAALEAELGKVQVFFTKKKFHAAELTRHALCLGATTLISIGGDGTLNEMVNGFFFQGQPMNRSATIALILRGTGGDFARSCEIPRTLPEALQAIKTIPPQPCDVIRMIMEPLDSPAERYVINVADVGVGGALVDVVNHSPKFLGGPLTFFLAGLWVTFFRYKNAPLQIELDGKLLSEYSPHYFVAVANGTHFGGGMYIAPAAKLNDGVFDVVMVGDLTLPEKFYFAYKLYKGQADQLKKVRLARGHQLKITSRYKVPVDADGEFVGYTGAQFEIIPAALNLAGFKSMRR